MYFIFSYKPFFNKTDPSQLESDENEIIPHGVLDLTCMEVTRLSVTPEVANTVYCTFTVGMLSCSYNEYVSSKFTQLIVIHRYYSMGSFNTNTVERTYCNGSDNYEESPTTARCCVQAGTP